MTRADVEQGYALADLGRYEDAEAAFRQAIRLDPANTSAHDGLALVLEKTERDGAAGSPPPGQEEFQSGLPRQSWRERLARRATFRDGTGTT